MDEAYEDVPGVDTVEGLVEQRFLAMLDGLLHRHERGGF